MTEEAELLDEAMRDEHNLIAKKIRFHMIKVFASRDAETVAGEAMHRRKILQLLDQYALEQRAPLTDWPVVQSACADCGVGTFTLGEWYAVKDEVWAQAWAGRLKPWHALPGQQILCIGCLEARIGRTLMACDFTDAPINDLTDPHWSNLMSDRMRDRVGRPPMTKPSKRRRSIRRAEKAAALLNVTKQEDRQHPGRS
jgi:hypothetical protein